MNFDQEDVAKGMFHELQDVLIKYSETLLTPTVLGVLEMLKIDVIQQNSDIIEYDEGEGEDE